MKTLSFDSLIGPTAAGPLEDSHAHKQGAGITMANQEQEPGVVVSIKGHKGRSGGEKSTVVNKKKGKDVSAKSNGCLDDEHTDGDDWVMINHPSRELADQLDRIRLAQGQDAPRVTARLSDIVGTGNQFDMVEAVIDTADLAFSAV